MSDAKGGGSLTALPVIETQAGDVSAYIPTNVISITDGQVFLENELFLKVSASCKYWSIRKPCWFCSPIKSDEKSCRNIKLELAQFREIEAFSQFLPIWMSLQKKH